MPQHDPLSPAGSSAAAAARGRRFPASFFAPRWHGEVPLGRLFWQDMALYGTAINLAAAILAALLFVQDAPTLLAATVYWSPLPYNFFLLAAVWKSAAGAREPWVSAARVGALAWAIAMTII